MYKDFTLKHLLLFEKYTCEICEQGFFQAFIAATIFSFKLSFHAKAEGICPCQKQMLNENRCFSVTFSD